MAEPRIMTLHPEGKKGVNILESKYNQIRDYILDLLDQETEISYKDLNDRAVVELKDTFEGSIPWYVVSVKLDLEARGAIKRVPGTSPHRIRKI